MTAFVQIIEYQTDRIEEMRQLGDEMQASGQAPRFTTLVVTKDRDRPDTYLTIVEFPSYEAAMENNNDPETQKFAAQMGALASAPPKFYNLDVMDRMP
jgi:quinol monooxygenase YgiN